MLRAILKVSSGGASDVRMKLLVGKGLEEWGLGEWIEHCPHPATVQDRGNTLRALYDIHIYTHIHII